MSRAARGRGGGVPGQAAFERGLAAQRGGQSEKAIAAYREALGANPGLGPAHFNLGQLLRHEGRLLEATASFTSAARLRPSAADAWLNLGLCRELGGELDAAILCYRRAASLDPRSATARFNLGNALKKRGDLVPALATLREAAGLEPKAPEIHLNIGSTLRELGDPEAAAAALRAALELRPGWTEARWNLALARLAGGCLSEGWELYDVRWDHLGLPGDRGLRWPRWRGEPIDGRRLLVWREQGLGDELLFGTCVPDLAARGAEVTLAVDPRLVPLLARAFPAVRVVADPEWGDGPFSYQVPLGSLPRYLRATRASFPGTWSTLAPDRHLAAAWTDRLASIPARLKVGLCWRSGARSADRSRHYAPLVAYRPVLEVPGVAWINLQYGECEEELLDLEATHRVRVHRWEDVDLRDDLESVAALIWNLDLVVSAPTAVSSLAGALGSETWQVESGNDWSAFGESRSPWLPSIRLFRRAPGEPGWDGTLRALADALRERTRPAPAG